MSSSGAPPPEITAEWTVHAQLTLSHQGSSSNCDKPSNNNADPEDPKAAADQNESDLSRSSAAPPPVKVVYKFSTADSTAEGGNNSPNAKGKAAGAGAAGAAIFGDSTVDGSTTTTQSNDAVSSDKPPVKPSTASSSPNDDSGLSNTTSSASASERPTATTLTITPHLFPKCTSTCSIVLTADLHPGTPQTTSGDNTATTIVSKCASTSKVDKFTLFPEPPRVYEAKDASCQTSDIEAALDKLVRSSGDDLRKKGIAGDVPQTEKYNSLTRKSPLSTTADIISPSNTLQSQRSSQKDGAGGAGNRKKPRTVHIDVYCTGSDAESSSSSDAESSRSRSVSSSSSSGSRFDTSHFVELKSAAAAAAAAGSADASHPTVYESEEMKVRHKRAGKHEVPRRLLQQTVDQSTLSTIGSLKKAGSQNRKRCSTKEEINESKQILFSRILGEAPKEMTPFPEYLPRDPSDDNLSSNYPFSNRSTKRDITGSSLSSALASAGGDEVGDLDEATGGIVNLHRSGTTATHSDSFEYENSEDRFRIHEMERVWGKQSWKSPSVERKLLEIHNPQHASRRRNSESDNLSESDHSFVYDSPSRPGPSEPSNHSQAEFSDSSPSTVKSCPSPKSRTASNAKKILQQALLKAAGPPQTRVWSPVEGYSTEYLALARRFGSLITGKRKPGVHMGPVRNPECQCEHCRRWVIEREGGLRERALSVDDSPYNIVDMRRKYHLRNYQSSLAP